MQPKGAEECRVYYSCVTRLRTWVPGPVYALLTKAAIKQATVWLDHESLKEWEEEKIRRAAARRMRTPQQLMSGFRDQASAVRGALKRKRLGLLSSALPEVSSRCAREVSDGDAGGGLGGLFGRVQGEMRARRQFKLRRLEPSGVV